MSKIEKLGEELLGLTILEAKELNDFLEERGIKAAAAVAVAAPAAGGGEAHSAEAVRHKIKSLIDKETADAVLSDDRIVDILRADGVEIARRTVAKYREAMRIPSSVQRRRRMRA